MLFFDILFIAIGLAMDAFTVAMAVGLHLSNRGGVSFRHYFRLAFHFGLFQFLMPVVGWAAGLTIRPYIEAYDHWVALILLTYIGIRLVREGRRTEEYKAADPTKGATLVLLSVATSIDALATGLSLALLGAGIVFPSLVIGIVAAAFTAAGLALGRTLGLRWRGRVALVGGLILIGIGVKILFEHLNG
jgi:manganese efflux pump family protein